MESKPASVPPEVADVLARAVRTGRDLTTLLAVLDRTVREEEGPLRVAFVEALILELELGELVQREGAHKAFSGRPWSSSRIFGPPTRFKKHARW